MNMLNRMGLAYTYLMIIKCLTFVSIYGKAKDLFPSCDVVLMVRRNTHMKIAPNQSLTVKCPVKHCGKSLEVTWCKLLDTDRYGPFNKSENVEIRQNNNHRKDELISYLTFKRISMHDEGMYRCDLERCQSNFNYFSHAINISVSDRYQGFEISDHKAAKLLSSADNKAVSWLPYFYICACIVLLIVSLILLTLLNFYCWKRIMTYKLTKAQKMSNHMIPDLPKRSSPTVPVLTAHFSILNDIYAPGPARTPSSPPHSFTNGNQPLASMAKEGQPSGVYAVINHRQSRIPARKQGTVIKQDKKIEYTTVAVS
ncbi:B- and T-lymphocyte attenuator [Mastacembelus armatus]|uniref:B- and T-lymphocyte attenuator n=1 Tax=Mastacembelus armatus TaxID=205130 RepID=UPI000E464B91|nr:B- and T-lymphocyte attenuator [Mastacembelus armatus]